MKRIGIQIARNTRLDEQRNVIFSLGVGLNEEEENTLLNERYNEYMRENQNALIRA